MENSSNDSGSAFDSPMQARARSADSETSELRGECPRWILNALDAVSFASDSPKKSRMAIANEVLAEWAKKKRHELMFLQRLDGGNPTGPESSGSSR